MHEFSRRRKNIDPCSSLSIVQSVYLVCLVCQSVCPVCIPICLSVSHSACLSIGWFVSLFLLSFCHLVGLFVFLPNSKILLLSVRLSVCFTAFLLVYLSILSVGVFVLSASVSDGSVSLLSIGLSLDVLSIRLSVCPSVWLSV